MSRAGISGMGVISALGDGLETTRKALFAAEPLPNLPRRFETALKLPVFEIPEPAPVGDAGLPFKERFSFDGKIKEVFAEPDRDIFSVICLIAGECSYGIALTSS